MQSLIIASRKSPLAIYQTNFVKDKLETQYPLMDVKIKTFDTFGDQAIDRPLSKIGGKGLFTKELEHSMMQKESDIAVHSLKDVPVVFPNGFILGACLKREDPRDCFLSQRFKDLDDLSHGAIVGTTSLRRRMQILIHRPDLNIKVLRGNINTRISKLQKGDYDAIILAQAGVNRLDLSSSVKYCCPISLDIIIPAMGQASLAVECRDNNIDKRIISFLNDADTEIETTIERDFVRYLNGGCQAPIGVFAKIKKNTIKVDAIVGKYDGSEYIKKSYVFEKDKYTTAGISMAEEFIDLGAKNLFDYEANYE